MADNDDIALRNWQKVPVEMQRNVVQQVLLKPTYFEDARDDDGKTIARPFEDTVLTVEDFEDSRFFDENAMRILTCKVFDKDMGYEALYSQNVVRFGRSNRQQPEALRYDYCLPPPSAHCFLKHVLISLRVDAEDWYKLMRYADAIQIMPNVKHIELEFVEHSNAADDVRHAMQAEVQRSDQLLFRTKKLTVTYREVGQIVGAIVPPTYADRNDYENSALVFDNVAIDPDDDDEEANGKAKVMKLEEKRYWSDYETEVETDKQWGLDAQIVADSGRAWHKRMKCMMKTTWV